MGFWLISEASPICSTTGNSQNIKTTSPIASSALERATRKYPTLRPTLCFSAGAIVIALTPIDRPQGHRSNRHLSRRCRLPAHGSTKAHCPVYNPIGSWLVACDCWGYIDLSHPAALMGGSPSG